MDGLPENVLAYLRTQGSETNTVLLNFGDTPKEVQLTAAQSVFALSEESGLRGNVVRLAGYGGVILKQET